AQIKFWGNDFRTLRDMRKEIQTGLETELRKYQETISRGSEVVVRLSKDLASRGIQKIPVEQLVQLYDSQGLSPEIVKEGAEKKVGVVDVQKFGDRIVHFLAGPLDANTDLVEGEIDWQRRQNLMRHHTGTHVLLGAARRVLGEHVWQAGAQKEVESSRLDITHYQQITQKEKERIERLANQTILRDLPVRINWMAREKAEAKYGYRLYQGGAVPGSKIRVVRIVGWDAEACGGTHVKRTGELGV